VLTFAATVIELVSKFLAGAWLIAGIIPVLVLAFVTVPGVRADRQAARDRPGSGAAGQVGVAGRPGWRACPG